MREINEDFWANQKKMVYLLYGIQHDLNHLPPGMPSNLDKAKTMNKVDIFREWYASLAGRVEELGQLFDELDIIQPLLDNTEEAEAALYAAENPGPE